MFYDLHVTNRSNENLPRIKELVEAPLWLDALNQAVTVLRSSFPGIVRAEIFPLKIDNSTNFRVEIYLRPDNAPVANAKETTEAVTTQQLDTLLFSYRGEHELNETLIFDSSIALHQADESGLKRLAVKTIKVKKSDFAVGTGVAPQLFAALKSSLAEYYSRR